MSPAPKSKAAAKPQRRKIAIVGGGPAGLSAAFHLTQEAGWQEKYEISVYQLGWRIGGKGATGRDPANHMRIEEHGIHGFCNFYFNTFAMMREVYAALDPAQLALLPTPSMQKAFAGSSRTYAIAARPRGWADVLDFLPATPGDPWDPGWTPNLSWKAVLRGILIQLAWRGRSDEANPAPGFEDIAPPALVPPVNAEGTALHGAIWQVWRELDGVPDDLDATSLAARLRSWIGDLDAQRPSFGALVLAARSNLAGPQANACIRALRALSVLDLYWTLLRGLVSEGLLLPGAELDAIDGRDYRAWLEQHGLSELVLSSPILSSVANILFAYPHGDTTAQPQLSAASWASWMLRSVVGRGAYFYFMSAGTGESVVLPLYLALVERGVRFEFFHKLVGVKSSGGTRPALRELRFKRQARTKKGRAYQPLVKVVRPKDGASFLAWPNRPNTAQLEDATRLRELDLEAFEPQPAERNVTLRLGKDFDHVVWAVPPSVTRLVADGPMKKRWAFTECLGTTATQACQVWLTKSTKDLGWDPQVDVPAQTGRATERYACSSFPQPLNAFVVFDDLIEYEAWPAAEAPHGLIYLCAQLQELDVPVSEKTRNRDERRVEAGASGAMRLFANFLRGASVGPRDPQALNFDLLHVAGRGAGALAGEARLRRQYFRVNTRPTEAYVQANPGTAAARLYAWESGFANVALAGDWAYTGMNMGAFESAVTGGKLAAFALRGDATKLAAIVGFDFLHGEARKRAERALASGVVPMLP